MSFVYHSIYIGYTISTDVYAMYIHWMLKCLLGITNIGPVSKISIVPDLKASVGQCWLDLIITYIRPILATNVVPISSLVGRHWPNTGPLVNSYMGRRGPPFVEAPFIFSTMGTIHCRDRIRTSV